MGPEDAGLRALRDEVEATLQEIDALVVRQRDVARDTAEASAVLATIKASHTWKTLEAYRAARLYLRAKGMRWRGLRARAVSAARRREIPRAVRERPLGVNIAGFAAARGRAYFRDRYTIGYWFWELSRWRDDWLEGFNHVDEVWVASEFTRACLAEVSPVPIVTMPLPFVLPEPPPIGRAHFGLRGDATVFLLTFDVS